MGWRLTLLNACLGAIQKPALARADPQASRRRFERQGHLFRAPPLSLFLDDRLGNVAVSPWADLTRSGNSITENANSERILLAGRLQKTRDGYSSGSAPNDPGISPLFADFTGAPPVFLQCASTEILRDDTLRLAENLKNTGVDVTLDQGGDIPHVWVIFQGHLPEADAALLCTAEFIRQQVPYGPQAGS